LRCDFLRPGVSTKPGRSGLLHACQPLTVSMPRLIFRGANHTCSTHTGVFPACERVTRIDMAAVGVVGGALFQGCWRERAAATRDGNLDKNERYTEAVRPRITSAALCDSCRPPMAQSVEVGVFVLTSCIQNLVARMCQPIGAQHRCWCSGDYNGSVTSGCA
jgi:hypothetical protein